MLDKQRLQVYFWLSPFYFAAVSVSYLWGYWGSFDINIFEYAEISYILSTAIIPIGGAVVILMLAMCLNEIFVRRHITFGGIANSIIGPFYNKHRSEIFAVYAILVLIYAFSPVPKKWLILPALIAVPFTIALHERPFFTEISNQEIRFFVIYIIIILPFYLYGRGRVNADFVLDNIVCSYVEIVQNQRTEKYKFLGHTNQYVFLLSMDNEDVIISKFDKLSPLHIYLKEPSKKGKGKKNRIGDLESFDI